MGKDGGGTRMTPAELLSLRRQYPHLDNYQSWIEAGKPCAAKDWPRDEVVVTGNVVSGGGRGYANVTQRRGNKSRRNRRKF